ncbi:MAG: hypothetical protein FWH11_08485 [Micrococcales bacterium]|nr:hypothetical protein [Micrococcales bacterium]
MSADFSDLMNVDWASLDHAYSDSATDTPELIQQLLDPDEADGAAQDLFASILHQGTIYSATIPAVGFLARLVEDDEAPGQGFAAWFLQECANLARYERDDSAKQALVSALPQAIAGLGSVHTDVRMAIALLCLRIDELPDTAMERLDNQLAVETDTEVRLALKTALGRHGGSGQDPVVRFAALYARLVGDGPVESTDLTELVGLWPDRATDFEALMACETARVPSPIESLVAARQAEILPLLDQLADSPQCLPDAITGYTCLGQQSRRRLLGAAVSGLVAIALRNDPALNQVESLYNPPGGPTLGGGNATLRNRLLLSLAKSAPGIQAAPVLGDPCPVSAQELADAIVGLVASDPRPHWTWTLTYRESEHENHQDIRADAIVPLMALGDDRWLDMLAAALSSGPPERIGVAAVVGPSSLADLCQKWVRDVPPGHLRDGLTDLMIANHLSATSDDSVHDGGGN